MFFLSRDGIGAALFQVPNRPDLQVVPVFTTEELARQFIDGRPNASECRIADGNEANGAAFRLAIDVAPKWSPQESKRFYVIDPDAEMKNVIDGGFLYDVDKRLADGGTDESAKTPLSDVRGANFIVPGGIIASIG